MKSLLLFSGNSRMWLRFNSALKYLKNGDVTTRTQLIDIVVAETPLALINGFMYCVWYPNPWGTASVDTPVVNLRSFQVSDPVTPAGGPPCDLWVNASQLVASPEAPSGVDLAPGPSSQEFDLFSSPEFQFSFQGTFIL